MCPSSAGIVDDVLPDMIIIVHGLGIEARPHIPCHTVQFQDSVFFGQFPSAFLRVLCSPAALCFIESFLLLAMEGIGGRNLFFPQLPFPRGIFQDSA